MTYGNWNKCSYWNCGRRIDKAHFLCREHFEDLLDGFIDQCPICGRFKDMEYDLCLDCYNGRQVKIWNPSANIKSQIKNYSIEHNKAWEGKDRGADKFFVYVLKLDRGEFYVGQTRDLRARLLEHKDNKTKSTAGRNPELKYFEILNSREAVESREAELKKLNETNPREIRKMVISFQDLIKEVNLG